jgi:hypothetical protein
MRNVLLQLDTSPFPSVFDRVVALDAGADDVLSYGGVTPGDVRDLIHGCIFTRSPKDLAHTAVFIGGADMAAGERLLEAARAALLPPFTVSLMLDSNGSNTTAVAAVAKMVRAAGDVRGKRAVVVAGTGPVGLRAAGLLARAGADVLITSRRDEAGERAATLVQGRFGARIRSARLMAPGEAAAALHGAALVLAAGPAGVTLVPRSAWARRVGLHVAADVNAVPPPGIEGIDAMDDGAIKDDVTCFGALAVGHLKMKVHKACIARLFERNDAVLDAETIAEVAAAMPASRA